MVVLDVYGCVEVINEWFVLVFGVEFVVVVGCVFVDLWFELCMLCGEDGDVFVIVCGVCYVVYCGLFVDCGVMLGSVLMF